MAPPIHFWKKAPKKNEGTKSELIFFFSFTDTMRPLDGATYEKAPKMEEGTLNGVMFFFAVFRSRPSGEGPD